MKKSLLAIVFVFVMLLLSCDLFNPPIDNDPPINMSVDNDSIPEWYPSRLVYSSERYQEYNSLLDSFKTTYNITNDGLTSNSVLTNIQSLHSNPIQVCEFTAGGDTLETLRNGVYDFVSDWWRLLCPEPFEIDSIRNSLNFRLYPASHYETPVYNSLAYLGCVKLFVNTNGELYYLISSLIPQLSVPKNPIIDANSARNMAIGYEWYYYGYSGNRVDCVVDSSQINSTSLNVYIDRSSSEYVYRLIWCVRTSGLSIDILFDAITGEFLKHIQLFRT